ncbi:MAG: hypothetical protein K2Y51_02265 [Gammaproteobacteria bacterium]|jgi:hypothetical protein|nr:hypothetical protein [Gammaproteobacteria bacterium]
MLLRALAAGGLAVIAGFATPAQAAYSGIYFDLGDGTDTYEESTSGPVADSETHYYDIGSSHQYAAASFEQQTLRARTGLTQYGSEPRGSWITVDTDAEYSKEIVVPDAPFGPPGTLASMPLALRFDGHALASGGFFADGRSLSTVDTYFDFTVVDLDDLVCTEGCRPRELVAFGLRGYVSFDSGFGAAGRESVASYYWRAVEGGVTVDEDSYDFSSNEPGIKGAGETRYSVDSGQLNLDVVSRVGHRLRFEASLDVFVQSLSINGWSNVEGDFGQTFDADLLLPGGGAIAGETLGVFTPEPVPLPGAIGLLGAALLPLARRVRRLA